MAYFHDGSLVLDLGGWTAGGLSSSLCGCLQEAVLSLSQRWLNALEVGSGSFQILKAKTQELAQYCFCCILWLSRNEPSQIPREETWTPSLRKEDLGLSFIYHVIESKGQLRKACYQEAELKIYSFEKSV